MREVSRNIVDFPRVLEVDSVYNTSESTFGPLGKTLEQWCPMSVSRDRYKGETQMSKTFAMPVNAKKGFLMLAEEMISLAAPGLLGIDDLKSAVAKVEASLDTEEITLSDGEMIAMAALGECSDILQTSLRLKKAQEALVDEMPELSQEQVVSYAGIILLSAPEDQKGSPVYKATVSLLQTVKGHPGGGCELSPEEHHAYMAIKRMYYAGSFGKE